MIGYTIELDKSAASLYIDALPELGRRSAQQALNRAADFGRTLAAKEVRSQVAFPAAYLGPGQGRLTVSSRANLSKLEAVISGRDRPTSLRRFAVNGTPMPGEKTPKGRRRRTRDGSITVEVKPGVRKKIRGAFIVANLRGGNMGLAVRTAGPPPKGAWKPTRLAPGVWLLSGPSVDQVLRSTTKGPSVFQKVEPQVADKFEAELMRLMVRGAVGGSK